MKRVLGGLLFLLWAAAVQAVPQIHSWRTENGAKVLFLPAPDIPMVDIRIAFAAGSARDGAHPGLAKLTNSLLDLGAAGLNTQTIAETLDSVGAELSGGSARDMAWLHLRSLSAPEYVQPASEIFAKLLQSPDFPPSEVARMQRQLLILLQEEQQSPEDLAEKALMAALYRDHPYGSPPNGTPQSVQALSRAQVVAFYRQYYVARNLVLAVVGDLDLAAAKRLAERVVGNLPAGQAAPALPPVPPLTAAKTISIEFPSGQTHVLIGALGMQRGEQDYFDLYVGNHILGGNGFASQLMQEVREKRGLVYGAYSYLSPMQRTGPFVVGLQTRASQAEEALKVAEQTLQAFIAKGPQKSEVQDALDNLIGGFALRVDSNRELVDYLMMIGFYDLPLDYLDQFQARLKNVDQTSIQRAFRQKFATQPLITVILGGQGAGPSL